MDPIAIAGAVMVSVLSAFIVGIAGWNAAMRKQNKRQDMDIASLSQYQQNQLVADNSGNVPLLAGHEFRISLVEGKLRELDAQGDVRFKTIMDKLEENRREAATQHREMEDRMEARFDRKLESLPAMLKTVLESNSKR